jgi:hypothetical protein
MMLKVIFDKFGGVILSKWWASLHHPHGFAIRYVFWTSALVVFVVSIFTVNVPFQGKTIPEWWLGNEVEQYRLHANTKSLVVAKDNKDTISAECVELKRQIAALRLARWQLMGVSMPEQARAIELDMASTELNDLKKKLAVAELSKSKATLSYEILIAQR